MSSSRHTWSNDSPLTVGKANEGIKFVEDEESSSDFAAPKTPEIVVTQPEEKSFLAVPRSTTATSADDNYTEISSESSSFVETRIPIPSEKKPSPKTRKNSDIVLNLLVKTASFRRKSRREYDKVSTKEENTYCSIQENAEASDTDVRRKISGSATPDGKKELKGDDDEQILETLRQVVRKCTNADPLKRPSSVDVFDLVVYHEKP